VGPLLHPSIQERLHVIPAQRCTTTGASRTLYVPGSAQEVAAAILVLSATGWTTEAAVRLHDDLWRVEVSAAE
jgi:hypothetical protein